MIHLIWVMNDSLGVESAILASLVFVGDINEVNAVLAIVNKVFLVRAERKRKER